MPVHSVETVVVESVVILLIAATIVGIISSRIKLPYTVTLVLVGVVLKAAGLVPGFELTQQLLTLVFLPALLFEAAIHFPARDLKEFAPTIATLALPSVILTALATAFVLQVEFSTFGLRDAMNFSHFLLFGTIIAATDPISVITLFRQLGVPRKLALLVEGESLFNDGTAIVLYTVVLSAITSGVFSLHQGIIDIFVVSAGGILVGAIAGLFSSFVITIIEDHLLTIAITTVTAYGSFLVADQLHVSGILATVVAGLFVGNSKKIAMSANTRLAVVSFWEYVSFFLGSLVFLMIGLEVHIGLLIDHGFIILLAFGAVLASRAVSVFLPLPIFFRLNQPIDLKSATVVWWAGLRGSLSMVLALSLPESLAVRDVLIAMTFGVVVLSVVVQGSTMGMLLKSLGFVRIRSKAASLLGKNLAKLRMVQAKIREIERFPSAELPFAKEIAGRLKAEKAEIIAQIESNSLDADFIKATEERVQEIESHLEQIARDSLRRSSESNLVTEQEASEITHESAKK